MAAPSTCVCAKPDESPGLTCGECGRRRLGDDLDAQQFADLIRGLWLHLVAPTRPEPRLHRSRRRALRHVD